MLAGLAAVVLPAVLHLLSRARVRRVEWGAMLFLEDVSVRQMARARWSHRLLMLIRALAIAALSVALARPVLMPASADLAGARTVMLVVDASASTGYVEAGGPRLDAVRQAALRVLGQLARGDRSGLVTLGFDADAELPPTTDLQDVASRLAALATGPRRAVLADGIARAEALLGGETPASILCVADCQADTWQGVGRAATDATAPAPAIVATAVGGTRGDNARIVSVRQRTRPAIAGQPIEIEIALRNDGLVPLTQTPVMLKMWDRTVDQSAFDLPAGSDIVVRRTITLPRPGSAVVTAEIAANGLPIDDAVPLAIDVIASIRVRVITGERPADVADSPRKDLSGPTDLLRAALVPRAVAGVKGDDAFRFTLSPQSKGIAPERLDRLDRGVLVLAGVTNLSAAQRREIEQFVYRGGGLLLVPGATTTAAQWNADYWQGGAGLGPAATDSAATQSTGIAAVKRDHPAFAFRADGDDALPATRVERWLRFAPAGNLTTLVMLQSGDAWMTERAFGRGRVIAVATPLDRSWSDVPESTLFLPMIQSLLRHLVAVAETDHNLPPGAAIEHAFTSPRDRDAYIGRPDGRTDRVPMAMTDDAGLVIYTATDLPGRYALRTAGQPGVDFAIARETGESEMTMLADADIDRALEGTRVRRVEADALLATTLAGGGVRDGFLPALAIVMIALAIELFVASRFDAAGAR